MTNKITLAGVITALVVAVAAYLNGPIPQPVQDITGVAEFNTGKVVYDQLADQVLKRKTVKISESQIDDLDNDEDGIELLPAVGSSKVQEIVSITGFNKFSSESFNRGAANESFEIKWADSGLTASGGNGGLNIGASFSNGFLTAGNTETAASKNFEVWYPYNPVDLTANSATQARIASSSAVQLSGLVDVGNADADGYFIFEIIYRVWNKPE